MFKRSVFSVTNLKKLSRYLSYMHEINMLLQMLILELNFTPAVGMKTSDENMNTRTVRELMQTGEF